MIFAVVVLAVTPAMAGHYQLIKGRGVAVCQAYARNFESFRNTVPMACERRYNPAIKGFSAPRWRKLDLKKNLELYIKAGIYLQEEYQGVSGMSKEDIEADARYAASRAKDLKAQMFLAHLDLTGDGRTENILAIRERSCGPQDSSERTRLYVLNNACADINYTRQRGWGGYDSNATIELYRDKPYIEAYNSDDGWGNLFTKSGHFYVFRELRPNERPRGYFAYWPNFRLKRICEFKYIPSAEKKK